MKKMASAMTKRRRNENTVSSRAKKEDTVKDVPSIGVTGKQGYQIILVQDNLGSRHRGYVELRAAAIARASR